MTSSLPDDAPRPRLCHLRKWPDFNGYGFNLHAEKGTAGQFIGSVDDESPCDAAGLRVGDRIIEVNGINIGSENHQQVVTRIKAVPNETKLLVIDSEGEEYYKSRMIVITGDMENIMYLETPVENPYTMNKRDTDDDDDGGETEDASNKMSEMNKNEDSGNLSDQRHNLDSQLSRCFLRLCKLKLWSEPEGYGFTMQTIKGKPGNFVGSVDPGSCAEHGGLRVGDRIVKINGEDVSAKTHIEVVNCIKKFGTEVSLLVIDPESYEYFTSKGIILTSSIPKVVTILGPDRNPSHDAQDSPDVSQDYKAPSYKNDGSSDDNDVAGSKEYNWQKQEPEPEKIVTPIVTPSPTYSHNSQPSYESKPSSASDVAKPSSDKEHTLPSNASSVSAASSGRSSGGLEFAGSAREARERMSKKRNVKEGCMTLKDKYDLLQKL